MVKRIILTNSSPTACLLIWLAEFHISTCNQGVACTHIFRRGRLQVDCSVEEFFQYGKDAIVAVQSLETC